MFVPGLQTGAVAGQSLLVAHCTHFFVCGLQTGAEPGHSELFVQFVPHVFVVGSQMGAVGGQSAFPLHCTHFFVCGLQMGASPGHSELLLHSFPQVFVVVLQIGDVGGQSVFPVHCTHFFVCGLQTGVSFGHCELFVQLEPHVFVVVLQIGVVAGQSELPVHCTQVFVTGLQTGADPGHCELLLHVAVHTLFAVQTGFDDGQSAPVKHSTHVLFDTLQCGFEPTQKAVFPASHSTQRFVVVLHTGRGFAQFASLAHPVVQVCEVTSQIPFGPVHCALLVHSTQTLAATSQTGFPPTQLVAFVAEHSTQAPELAPEVRHAGVGIAEHASGPEPRSPAQATHVPAGLQTGVVPEHWPFVLHWTHVWLVVLHTGVAPVQSVVLLLVQGTHMPASGPVVTQAGAVGLLHARVAPDPKSPLQAPQVPPKQNGFVPEHWASLEHSTHVFVVVSQTGVVPPHWVESRHWTHWLVAVLHFGVVPEQFRSLEHPAVHVKFVRLQMPLAPTHCAFDVHWTHLLRNCPEVAVLHTGLPGGHAVTFTGLFTRHSAHEPLMQAGRSVDGHLAVPGPGPLSPSQATHAPATQTGVDPVHSALVRHWTQMFWFVSHTSVVPVQCVAFPALHSTQAPAFGAGGV